MKTNINKIKQAAYLFLDMPIETDDKFDFICHHPFIKDTYSPVPCEKTVENPVGLELLDVRDESNLKKVKDYIRRAIDKCGKATDFFIIINKPYSGVFFKVIKDLLSNEDYAEMLEMLWTSMEYPNADVNVSKQEWIDMWKKADLDLIYSKDDKDVLARLPERFLVYRGLMKGAKKEALSWTLDQAKAVWFAKRFNYNGKVYKAICNKKDILAYLSCRNEDEIVVDWRNLENISEVSYI